MRSIGAAAVILGLSACGGAARVREAPIEASAPAAPPAPAPLAVEGTIARGALDAVLAQGFGRFLQSVSTEPHLAEGRFVGHRVTELRGAWYAGIDLRPGDTLIAVNGMPIERPEEALLAWDGLRVSSELTVEYLRAGERRRLRFAIEQ